MPQQRVRSSDQGLWWRANRPATAELFEQEFLDAMTLIAIDESCFQSP